jgi:hypothetical protein
LDREPLNVRHIRDLLDYIEAEAMAGVREHREGQPHPDFVTALKEFIGKYGVHIPVVLAPVGLSPERTRQMQEGFARDWRGHESATRALRPLLDLALADAEGRDHAEQSRLFRLAFPQGTAALTS